MHWYKRNIGDYAKKAGRLTMIQHGSYTLLIDACYDREQFPTLEDAIEWCWASTNEEIAAVEFVLNRFFKKDDNGVFRQKRIEEEIENYHLKSETNKRIAIERETNRKKKSTKRVQVVNEPPPNQQPVTNNQQPVTNNKVDANAINYVKIKEYWNKSNLREIRSLSESRKKLIKARTKNIVEAFPEQKDSNPVNLWIKIIDWMSQSIFLTNQTDWKKVDIDWILNDTNFAKILDGKYNQE